MKFSGVPFFLLYLCLNSLLSQTEIYSLVNVISPSDSILNVVSTLDCDHSIMINGGLKVALSKTDIDKIITAGAKFEVLIPDLTKYYSERSELDLKKFKSNNLFSKTNGLKNFTLGSCAGFLNLSEIETALRQMNNQYPALSSSLQVLGLSRQSKPIWGIRLSAKPEYDKTLPKVLFTAMHHAREPIGMMSLIYTMWWLLENYGKDFNATNILENYSIYFVLVVNPDGYQKNISDAPNGGGSWRRNVIDGDKLKNSVDLNRNYGPQEYWDSPIGGSSDTPGNDTYRGTSPFSEPETQAIRDYCLTKKFKLILNYHSYSNLLIEPFDWKNKYPVSDTDYYKIVSPIISNTIGYATGSANITAGYSARGVADDWMYDFSNVDYKTITWTPEVGSFEDGFWPIPSRIIPLCKLNNNLNLNFIRLSGASPIVYDYNIIIENNHPILNVVVLNIGREGMTQNATLKLQKLSDTIINIPILSSLKKVEFNIPLHVLDSNLFSLKDSISILTNYNGFENIFSFKPILQNTILFEDNFDLNNGKWILGDWDYENIQGRGKVISDSPYKKYTESSVNNILEMKESISLKNLTSADLSFDIFYEVQARNHSAALQIRKGSSGIWENIESPQFKISTSDTSSNRYYLLGSSKSWEKNHVNLDKYLGEDVYFRFVLSTPKSQYSTDFTGLQIDNLKVKGFKSKMNSIYDANVLENFSITLNQFYNELKINFNQFQTLNVRVIITNSLGDIVLNETTLNPFTLNVSTLKSGTYLIKILDGKNIYNKKFQIVR